MFERGSEEPPQKRRFEQAAAAIGRKRVAWEKSLACDWHCFFSKAWGALGFSAPDFPKAGLTRPEPSSLIAHVRVLYENFILLRSLVSSFHWNSTSNDDALTGVLKTSSTRCPLMLLDRRNGIWHQPARKTSLTGRSHGEHQCPGESPATGHPPGTAWQGPASRAWSHYVSNRTSTSELQHCTLSILNLMSSDHQPYPSVGFNWRAK